MSEESSAKIIRKMMTTEQKAAEAVRMLKELECVKGAKAEVVIVVEVEVARENKDLVYEVETKIMEELGGQWDFGCVYPEVKS